MNQAMSFPKQHTTDTTLWPPRQFVKLHDELHARPAMSVTTPSVVSYWAQHQLKADLAIHAMASLCTHFGVATPIAGARYHVLLTPLFDLRMELHGEFVSWQKTPFLFH